jgi:hypothetical protein
VFSTELLILTQPSLVTKPFTNQVSHCLLVVNFSSQASELDVETVRAIYLTTWGELCSFGNIKAFKKNKTGFLAQALKTHCRLFTPSRNNRKVLYQLIEEQTAFTFDKVGVADAPVVPVESVDDDSDPNQATAL